MSAPYRVPRQDFSRLVTARRLGGTYITLAAGSVSGRKAPGFAVVISKKSARKAVDRNTAKRRIRDIARDLCPSIPDGVVLVAYAKRGISEAAMRDLRTEIHSLFSRILPPGGRT